MYKKTFVLGLIFLGFFGGIAINYGYGEEYKQEDMKAVFMKFCNEGTGDGQLTSEGTVYTEAGKDSSLCLYVSNAGTKKMAFEYGFTKSTFTRGGDRACDSNMGTGNIFSMLIPWTEERKITIDPMTYQTIQEKIVIPPGMSGVQLGCLVYKLSVPELKNVGGVFNLEVRKTTYLSIVVGGESEVRTNVRMIDMIGGVFSTNKKVKAEVDKENNLKLGFLIENQGNVPQIITITGKIYNALGFQKDFIIDSKQLAPGSKSEFTTDMGILPSYKGLFSIKFNVTNTPQFMFAVSDENLKKSGNISEKGQIFIFSRIWVIALIVILFIIYRLFVPRRAKEIMIPTIQPPIIPTPSI